MNDYIVKLKNADGETCNITIYDCFTELQAKEEAEIERGRGWMAISAKVVK